MSDVLAPYRLFGDVLNTDELVERLDQCREELESLGESVLPVHPIETGSVVEEIKLIEELLDQLRDEDEFRYGITLIAASYFREYAQDLAEECGLLPDSYTWPISCIDWDRAVWELQMDYTQVTVGGRSYWWRA
jgi:hypothetical protein